MGLTPFPADLILLLAQAYDVTVFVETGTFQGMTAAWASEHFQTVHTIELSYDQYRLTKAMLAPKTNVTCHWGDSRMVLPAIVASLNGRRAVYYLDGHWSGEGTAGADNQCPLLNELACLSADDVVVIDDARLFLRVPFPPLDVRQWPLFSQVLAALPHGMFVQVVGDVIFAVPDVLQPLLTKHLYEVVGGR